MTMPAPSTVADIDCPVCRKNPQHCKAYRTIAKKNEDLDAAYKAVRLSYDTLLERHTELCKRDREPFAQGMWLGVGLGVVLCVCAYVAYAYYA